MSLELWTTIAAVGTLVVITATAIAAMIQLKHIRSGNQIAILNDFVDATFSPEFAVALDFVRGLDEKLKDPAFRAQLEIIPLPSTLLPIIITGRLFDSLGVFVRRGMLEPDIICELWAPAIYHSWLALAQTVVIMRRPRGDQSFASFEYLAYVAKQWLERNPLVYPPGIPRLAPPDLWLAEDRKPAVAGADLGVKR